MPKVLVTDASKREALAIIRSLGRREIEVVAADSVCFNAGFLSKYCKRRVIYPSPERSKTRFVRFLMDLVRSESFDLVIPVSDFTVVPIVEYKDDFERYVKVATPSYQTVLKAFDKAQTIKIASKENIPYPKTYVVEDIESVKKLANEVNYPAVIKPRMKVMWIDDKAILLKVTRHNYAWNREDFVKKYVKVSSIFLKFHMQDFLPLVQECVSGQGYGVEVLMHNSEPMALFMHRRLREYPIEGGASTLRESVKNGKLAYLGIKLLKAMNWDGVAMVEFKINKINCEPVLMEVNGRFWGSLALAISAGVDFPYLLYKIAIEGESFKIFRYNERVRQRWLIPGDILWLYYSLIFSGNKVQAIRDFMKSFNIPDDIISLDDPMPVIGAIVTMAKDCFDVIFKRRTLEGEMTNI